MVLEAQGATCNGLPYTPPRGVDLLGMDSLTWRPVEGRKRLGAVISHYRVEERLGGRFDQPRPSRKPQSATSVPADHWITLTYAGLGDRSPKETLKVAL